MELHVLMRYHSAKKSLFFIFLLVVWLNGMILMSGTTLGYDDLEIGDYLVYHHSIEESGVSDLDQFKIYYIQFIDTSNPNSEEIYASVYLSNMPTGGWVEVDVWK